ncbi:MAG: hypothetical protein RR415_08915 [Ruthenibacterium sp.]
MKPSTGFFVIESIKRNFIFLLALGVASLVLGSVDAWGSLAIELSSFNSELLVLALVDEDSLAGGILTESSAIESLADGKAVLEAGTLSLMAGTDTGMLSLATDSFVGGALSLSVGSPAAGTLVVGTGTLAAGVLFVSDALASVVGNGVFASSAKVDVVILQSIATERNNAINFFMFSPYIR